MPKQRTPFLDYTEKGYNFRLAEDILLTLAKEFNAEGLMQRIGNEKDEEKIKSICGDYGKELMKRTIELGEKYADRTYEVMKEVSERTGVGPFPHVAQRFLEIAYLGAWPLKELPVIVSTRSKVTYRVAPCVMFDALKAKCGDSMAEKMPCLGLCLTLPDVLYDYLKIKPQVRVEATMAKDKFCQFASELPR